MQPCQYCGGTAVDAAGYCTQCRNFRGVPPPPGYPPAASPAAPPAMPQGGQYAPVSGGGYTPTSGAPGYGPSYGPTSGAPYPYPTSGGAYPPPAGYPGGTPGGPPPRSRSSFTAPLIALSATLVVIVIAIVVVAVVRSGKKEPVANPTPLPSPSATPIVDTCVVGTWEVVSDEVDVPVQDIGKVRFSGKGGTVRLRADGTGAEEYGDGAARYTAIMKGQQVALVFAGKMTFDYRTSNGSVSYSHTQANGTGTMSVGGVTSTSFPLEADDDPAKYSCAGEVLTTSTTLRTVRLQRTSKSA